MAVLDESQREMTGADADLVVLLGVIASLLDVRSPGSKLCNAGHRAQTSFYIPHPAKIVAFQIEGFHSTTLEP